MAFNSFSFWLLACVASPKLGSTNSEVMLPIKDLCVKYGVPFYDFYCETEFQNESLYKEPMHLNRDGARAYTKYIISFIHELLSD